MFALLLLILWPIAELVVVLKVAESIGVILTLLLLILGWPAGVWLMRSEGRAAWRRLSSAAAVGRPPAREVIDGALVLIGGALLIVPGFITDAIGLLMLLPPTRALARGALVRNFQSRLVVRAAAFARPASSYDVDSTASDVDPPELRR